MSDRPSGAYAAPGPPDARSFCCQPATKPSHPARPGRVAVRGRMTVGAVAFLLAASAGVVRGQRVEAVIPLPDSFCRAANPSAIEYNPRQNEMYVLDDSGSLVIIDCAANAKVARPQVGMLGNALYHERTANKLYVPSAGFYPVQESCVRVWDCATRSVIGVVPVGNRPRVLCYDSVGRRLYVANYGSHSVTVVDATVDTVLATIQVGEFPRALCLNLPGQRLYTANRISGDFSIVDLTGDSVIATIAVSPGDHPKDVIFNPVSGRVYCSSYDDEDILVIDGLGDTVRDTVHIGRHPSGFCIDPRRNRIYCAAAGDEAVHVIDGATDSVIARVEVGVGPVDLVYDERWDRVWAAVNTEDFVVAISCSTMTYDGAVRSGRGGSRLELAGDTGGLYAMCELDRNVVVVDRENVGLRDVVYTGAYPSDLCYNPRRNKLYVACGGNHGLLVVIDAATYRTLKTMRVGYEPDYVCYNPLDDKVYCTARGVPGHLLVLDAGVDTVITTIQLGREPQRPSHNALNDRLYLVDFGFGRQVVVIDGRGDSIIHTIPLPHDPHFTTFLPFNNRLYVSVGTGGGYKMAIIDCSADTVTAVISEAGGGHPRSIAVYPERAKVYMDGYYGLNIFDAWGDSLLRTYSGVSTQATALCYFPPNIELFMPTSHLGDSIFIVDCTFDTFVDEVRVGNTPSDACLDPLTGKYYCLNYWSGSVTAIDAATHRVLRTLRVGELPNCVELDSCRHRLFVSTAGGSAVAVIQDSLAGIGDWLTGAGRGPGAATVVRGVISLQSPAAGRQSPASLLDACGRKVMELRAGANDVRHLVPGVYFVLAGTGRRPAKVLVCR